MSEQPTRRVAFFIGDPRHYSLEQRLLNTISLLNGSCNLLGTGALLLWQTPRFLLALHFTTGLLFLVFYYYSRFRDAYRRLYWPFVLSMTAFLFFNALGNAGLEGGAHYYLIAAFAIAIILSNNWRRTLAATVLFVAVGAALLLLQRYRPDLFLRYDSETARFWDVFSNFLFVILLVGALVLILARNLNQERSKSDRLLLNILPDSVAEELKRNDRVQPLSYPCATVLFSDFVGFTQIAEKMTPEELVRELDQSFRKFDEIAAHHRLEKIKTIGDSYMAAGGLPEPTETHAVDCVRAALEMQSYLAAEQTRRTAQGLPIWQIRIGIHSGPLIAGVIGQEKFAYDVWGDTVNLASGMESAGQPGRINISRAAYELVKDEFDCEPRGQITAKHKGEVEMYFVKGRKVAAAQDEAHSVLARVG